MGSYRHEATRTQKFILILLVLIIIAFGGWLFISNYEGKTLEAGVQVDSKPRQGKISIDRTFKKEKYTIIPLASFKMEGKILAKKRYVLGSGSDLAPYDLAMGWGRMSDETILDKIKISQIQRFYSWKAEVLPIPRREIEKSSANMHIIPANKNIKKIVRKADEWDVISLKGYLVKVIADDFHWKSSLTRNDTGDGACELIWVEEFEILKS